MREDRAHNNDNEARNGSTNRGAHVRRHVVLNDGFYPWKERDFEANERG